MSRKRVGGKEQSGRENTLISQIITKNKKEKKYPKLSLKNVVLLHINSDSVCDPPMPSSHGAMKIFLSHIIKIVFK